ncbi:MAG: hypothetical protein IJK81_07250 [Selenomonadaceae bacterium]|nr:hypothetical protein [Selenomonadaceae bacterium]
MSDSVKKILEFIGACIVLAGIVFLFMKFEILIGHAIDYICNLKGESGTYAIIPVASFCVALVCGKRIANNESMVFVLFIIFTLSLEILTFLLGHFFGIVVFAAMTFLSFLAIILSGIMWFIIPIYRFFK